MLTRVSRLALSGRVMPHGSDVARAAHNPSGAGGHRPLAVGLWRLYPARYQYLLEE